MKNRNNYNRLKDLARYGVFSWKSRPTVISELGKYHKYSPETLEFILPFIHDNDRFVRMAVIKHIGAHGSVHHFGLLDSAVGLDPVLSINALRAKDKINSRIKKKADS